MTHAPVPAPSELEQAIAHLEQIVRDGLKHGFFEYTLKCEMAKERKRKLTFQVGKSHQYFIPADEIEQ